MTQEEIIEGNKLIELFYSGRTLSTDGTFFGRKQGMPKQYENWYDIVSVGDLKYHSSWDWLMPVVEKINDTGIDNYGEIGVFIFPNNVVIGESSNDPITMCTIANHKSLIQMTWTAIVTFLKWYSKQPH